MRLWPHRVFVASELVVDVGRNHVYIQMKPDWLGDRRQVLRCVVLRPYDPPRSRFDFSNGHAPSVLGETRRRACQLAVQVCFSSFFRLVGDIGIVVTEIAGHSFIEYLFF
ncbi:hypothetical protein CPSG_07867 [Coccidioides posadasii str. Silveira]|uniref:Uncharacterized protein n=1 Tax=Coccidioides posadasii (strain RMSCC 757 / Silveira) TaxID=443226 RepID=E9DE76_COCPS|nr:hypothetical protein CPSG_07867 [Coccidioides posadasii str. Silveira]